MNNTFKKATFLIITVIALCANSNILLAQTANFSGTWKRNTEKCDAGDLSVNSIPIEFSVNQNAGQIELIRTSKNKLGEITKYAETLKFDGTPYAVVMKANLHKKASIKWSDDKKEFTETADYTDDQGNPLQKGKEEWSLSEDGNTLTIHSTLDVNGQSYLMTEVFNK